LTEVLHRIEHGDGKESDINLLMDICDNISGRSFCPLGDAATSSITSSIKLFRDEYLYHIREGHCLAPNRQFDIPAEVESTSLHPGDQQ
jgi:NADH-quinone oxidoreductase subunit F